MATDADVMPAPLEIWPSFALTAKARQAGAVALKVDTVHYTNAQMNRMLAELIYAGQSPGDLIWPAWAGALGVFVLRSFTRSPMEEPGTTPQRRRWTEAQGP